MTTPAPVSIAILTKNGAATLPALLDAISKQRTTRTVEIVAIDSGSTDGTLKILAGRASRAVSIVSIDPRTFNHGLTRNLAAEQASHDLVVFIVQDAEPADDRWLEALVAPFDDPRVAGAFARQLPRADASALTRLYLGRWEGAGPRGWTADIAGDAEWRAMSPPDRFARCTFDNVCSCVRRSVWKAIRFVETPIAEDMQWSRDVLLAGHRIVYAPDAVVRHSHDRSAAYEYRRTYVLHRRLYELFGLRTIPSAPLAARAVASCLADHLWCERAAPSAWPRAAALAVAWPLGQYLGARAAIRRAPLPAWRPGTV